MFIFHSSSERRPEILTLIYTQKHLKLFLTPFKNTQNNPCSRAGLRICGSQSRNSFQDLSVSVSSLVSAALLQPSWSQVVQLQQPPFEVWGAMWPHGGAGPGGGRWIGTKRSSYGPSCLTDCSICLIRIVYSCNSEQGCHLNIPRILVYACLLRCKFQWIQWDSVMEVGIQFLPYTNIDFFPPHFACLFPYEFTAGICDWLKNERNISFPFSHSAQEPAICTYF